MYSETSELNRSETKRIENAEKFFFMTFFLNFRTELE